MVSTYRSVRFLRKGNPPVTDITADLVIVLAVYAILMLNALWFIIFIIATSTECIPFAYNWDKTI